MGSSIRFMSSVSYFASIRFMTAFSCTWPGTSRSVMCYIDTTQFVEGVWIFIITITLYISAMRYNRRRIFWVTGVLFPWPKQPKWTSWSSECHFYTVLSRTKFWHSVWSLMLFTIILVLADEFWNDVLKYLTTSTFQILQLISVPYHSTPCNKFSRQSVVENRIIKLQRPESESSHSAPSTAYVKNAFSFRSISATRYHGVVPSITRHPLNFNSNLYSCVS
jgi:hypothetical protein